MLIDLHAHSHLSKGCDLDPRAVLERAALFGLDGVAFTETNTQDGCDELFEIGAKSKLKVFVGLELDHRQGPVPVLLPEAGAGARARADVGQQPGEALERRRVPAQGEGPGRGHRRGASVSTGSRPIRAMDFMRSLNVL